MKTMILSTLLAFASIQTISAQNPQTESSKTAKTIDGQEPSNYHFWHTETVVCPVSKFWTLWTDVSQWQLWDSGLQSALLQGPFQVGAKGKLVPDKGPKSKFKITEVDFQKSYTYKTRVPLGWLIVERRIESVVGDTITFTHEVHITGGLKRTFGRQFGKRYRAMLPSVMQSLSTWVSKAE